MVVIVLNVFQRPFEPFNHFKKRGPSKSKSEFREINFGIFMEQFKNVCTSLVSSHEIFARNLYLLLIICPHVVLLPLLSRCGTDRRPRQLPGQINAASSLVKNKTAPVTSR